MGADIINQLECGISQDAAATPIKQTRPLNWRIKDFCEASGIGKTKFYVLVKSGKIHLVKCGRTSLVTETERLRFQAALEAGEL